MLQSKVPRRLALRKQLLFLVAWVPLVACVAMFAADPQGFVVWKGSNLKDSHRAGSGELTQVGDFSQVGGYQALVIHREGLGEPEVQRDPLLPVIESGEATLAAGGEKKTVAEGDVVFIPANLPHQVLVASGKQVTYLVIRQRSSEAAPVAAPAPAGSSGKKPVLGIDLGSGFRACTVGDNSPEGTVVDGYEENAQQQFLKPVSCIWKSESAPEMVTTGSTGNKDRGRPGAEVGQGCGTVVDGYGEVIEQQPLRCLLRMGKNQMMRPLLPGTPLNRRGCS